MRACLCSAGHEGLPKKQAFAGAHAPPRSSALRPLLQDLRLCTDDPDLPGVFQSSLMKPLPNRLDEFIARLAETKKIFERNGAQVSFHRIVAGSEPEGVLFVSSVDDWARWAQCAAKLEADREWQALDRKSADDPAAEMLSSGILQEFELPV
jgi:hypothetical protein